MKKKGTEKLTKKLLIIGVASILACVPLGCGQSFDSAPAYENVKEDSYTEVATNTSGDFVEYDYVAEESGAGDTISADKPADNVTTNRKLIKTVRMTVETVNFMEMIDSVEKKVTEFGGYISDAYTYNGSNYGNGKVNRYAEITLRIPENCLDDFVEKVGDSCNVVEKTTTTEDVTLDYVDTQGKKNMYLAEEKSLLALLEQAERLEDITFLTTRLSEVRYNIENMESTLRTYDNLVDYATVHLSIDEVTVLTEIEEVEKGFWQNLGERFMNSLENIGLFFIGLFETIVIASPYFILLALIIGMFILAIKIFIAIIKKKQSNKLKKSQKDTQSLQIPVEERKTEQKE